MPTQPDYQQHTPLVDSAAKRESDVVAQDPDSNKSFWELTNVARDTFGLDLSLFPKFHIVDPEFKLEDMSEDMKKLPQDVQDKLREAVPSSYHAYRDIKQEALDYHDSVTMLSKYGMEGGLATVAGSMTDAPSLFVSTVGGVAGGAAMTARTIKAMNAAGKVRRAAKLKAAIAEAVGAEGALAGSKLAMNENYTSQDFTLDLMMAPVMAWGTTKLLNGVTGAAGAINRNNELFTEAAAEVSHEAEERAVRQKLTDIGIDEQDPEYEAAFMNARLDIYAQTQRSSSPTMRKIGHAVHADAVGTRGDKFGQGTTADITFDAKYQGILGSFNDEVTGHWRELMKANGVNWYNPFAYKKVNEVFEQHSTRIRKAIYNNNVASLSPAEQKIAKAYNNLARESLEYAQQTGHLSAKRLKHSDAYVQFRYDKDKIRNMMANGSQRKGLRSLFEEGYFKGVSSAGKPITRQEAKMLADITLNRLTDLQGMNRMGDIEEILEDPHAFLKQIQAWVDGGDIKYKNVEVQKLIEKLRGKGESSELKKRADLDRNVSVTLDDGSTLDFFKITQNNINELADGYARSMIGKGVLARHLDIYEPDDLIKLEAQVKKDIKHMSQAEQEKGLKLFNETVNRAQGRPGVEIDASATTRKNVKTFLNITYSAMLGGAGLAQVMDIFSAAFRNGLINSMRAMPLLRQLTRQGSEESKYLLDELRNRSIAFHSPNMMQKFNQFAEDGSYATDGLHYASRIIAEGVGNASGLSPLTRVMQESSYISSTMNTLKSFKNGKGSPYLKSETGWSESQERRFKNLTRKYTKNARSEDMDTDIEVPDFDKWPAKDAEDFMLGHYRIAMRQSSRSMAGENIRFLETLPGRILSQFKQIVFTSWARKFLHGVNNMGTVKGMQANALMMTGEMVGAYLMIYGKVKSKTAGMEQKKADEYAQRFGFENMRHFERLYSFKDFDDFGNQLSKLKPEFFMFSASYSPTLGGAFGLLDLSASMAGLTLPGRRYQPVESSMFSNPTLSLIERTTKGVAGVLKDGELNDNDYRNLKTGIAFNNWYGMHFLHNKIAQSLPEED